MLLLNELIAVREIHEVALLLSKSPEDCVGFYPDYNGGRVELWFYFKNPETMRCLLTEFSAKRLPHDRTIKESYIQQLWELIHTYE